MTTKICFQCGLEKPIKEFYEHHTMLDGHVNKCKECTKKGIRERYNKLIKDPSFVESERKRHREKYYRLGYKEKHKPTKDEKKEIMRRYKEKYPEKEAAKMHSADIKSPEGFEKHHWSYNLYDYRDVLFVSVKDHYTAHRYMIYDQERMMYRKLNGELLDSRSSHIKYINEFIDNKIK